MKFSQEPFRDHFWAGIPSLPGNARLVRLESVVGSQPGPHGEAVFDLVDFAFGDRHLPGLLAYRASLIPADVPKLKRRLRAVDDQLRLRSPSPGSRLLLVGTETAGRSSIAACEREGLGLIDLRGTTVIESGDVFIRTTGTQTPKRAPRTPMFRGKGVRVVRALLNAPSKIRTIRQLSQEVATSYAYCYDVVYLLEQAGFVWRRGPRSGVILRDPVGLLRAWIESGERSAVATEGFYARNTTAERLRQGFDEIRAQGIPSIFTLATGLLDEDRFVTALPHGLYTSASLEPVVQAFGLKRQTPHNFLVLRPEPASDTEQGGVRATVRTLPQGPAVAVPQLIVDFERLGGRGKEQADHLLTSWNKELPTLETDSP